MTGPLTPQSVAHSGAMTLGRSAIGQQLPSLATAAARSPEISVFANAGAALGGARLSDTALNAGRAWGVGELAPSLRQAVAGALPSEAALGSVIRRNVVAQTPGLGGQIRNQLGALGAIFSQVAKRDSTLLFVSAAGALVGALAWNKISSARSDSVGLGQQGANSASTDAVVPSKKSAAAGAAKGKLADLAGDWIIRQHREYNAFTPPAINNHICSTRYSTANIKVAGEQATMTEQLQLVEQGSKGLIKSKLAEPIEQHSYPKTQVLKLQMKDDDLAQVSSTPFEETLGFEKPPGDHRPAKFPDVGDRSKEQIDPVSKKGLGFLANVDVSFMMVHVTGRVRTMQILRGALEGDVVNDNTMRGDLALDFNQAVSFSDNKRVRDANPKTRYMNEHSDWVAVRRPETWGDDWAKGLSREQQLEALHQLFSDHPLKPGAEEVGQKEWAPN